MCLYVCVVLYVVTTLADLLLDTHPICFCVGGGVLLVCFWVFFPPPLSSSSVWTHPIFSDQAWATVSNLVLDWVQI